MGLPAPDFTRPTFRGDTLALASLQGHVILLNFWASWCAPCLAEMPVFARWAREDAQRGLRVIGVSMDDEASAARRVSQRLGLRYPLVLGDAALARSYGGVLGLPVTFLIDRRGVVRQRFDGAVDLQTLCRALDPLLQASCRR